jgi:ribose transport system substrate-binding protein
MGLDREKHPARFAIVTSAASGLVVATIATVVGHFDFHLLVYKVPLWVLILPLLAAVGSSALSVALLQNRRTDVFFASCALNEKRYIAELINDFHDVLDVHQLNLVLKVPRRDYAHTGQLRHLRSLRRQRGKYYGGIVIPAEPELIRPDLKEFCSFISYPIVFVDIEPFVQTEEYPQDTAFVGYHQDAIGSCAASYVEEHARNSRLSHPRIWVVAGKWYTGRQLEFIKKLRSCFENAEFLVDESGEYSRVRARAIVCRNLQDKSQEKVMPHYIFCTNDEMALGAVDALRIADIGNDGSVVVVGVDGTPEARALIDSQTTPLRATVVQDSCEIAEVVVDRLVRMNRGDVVRTRTYLEPRVHKSDHFITMPRRAVAINNLDETIGPSGERMGPPRHDSA